MSPPSPPAYGPPACGPSIAELDAAELDAIDWSGLSVVDPTPTPFPPARTTPATRDHDACLRSARQFYALWGE